MQPRTSTSHPRPRKELQALEVDGHVQAGQVPGEVCQNLRKNLEKLRKKNNEGAKRGE